MLTPNIETKSRFRILKGGKISLIISSLLGGLTFSYAAPIDGTVTSGIADISTNGLVTNITQTTNKASINWQSFSVSSGETVNFKQPNTSSITLNRVVGNEKSIINGALNANGQVWLLNSNGVLFGKNASINTSGIVATTAELSDEAFNAGNYNFRNSSSASVINEGTIEIVNNGSVILASHEVRNSGTIKAIRGKVHLVGANQYSVNLNGNSLINLKVDKGVLDALVENSGSVIADGGEIYLTTNAVDELLKGVVNNDGIVEANSLNGLTGKVELFAHGGTAKVGGTIEAQDGFIETSGKEFTIKEGAVIKTAKWLIDPVNVTIDATLAGTIQTALGTADVTITTDGGNTPDTSSGESGTNGDITVSSPISWSQNNTLTLSAANNIAINDDITYSGTSAGGLIFLYGQSSADGGSSSYNVATGKTVSSASVQWRKGSDLNSYRYAIVDNDMFIGNKYIELGISKANGGKFGSTLKPTLFFGRQSGSGIGMVGDADGFGTGDDLRVDYFLPGSPAEQFTVSYDATSGKNFANDLAGYELVGMNNDGNLEMKLTSTLTDLQVIQDFTLSLEDKFFKNAVTLTNVGSSSISNPTFVRSFDPDNTVDMGGSYSTINTIEKLISAGDSSTAVSAQSQTGDNYYTTTGKQAKILYYTTSSKASVGYGSAFFSGTSVDSMVTASNALSKGDTQTGDIGIGIIFRYDALAASESQNFSYLTSLDNRDISSILADLGTSSPTTTSTQNNDVEKVVTTVINQTAIKVEVPTVTDPFVSLQPIVTTTFTPAVYLGFSEGTKLALVSKPLEGEPTRKITLSEIQAMQSNPSEAKSNTDSDTGNTPVFKHIRVPMSQFSKLVVVDDGLNMPKGVDQVFYVVEDKDAEK